MVTIPLIRNRTKQVLCLILLCFLIVVIPKDSSGSSEDQLPPRSGYPSQDGGNDTRFFEYRSIWCDGYDIVNISMVKKLVAFARDHNFNCLSPLINGNYYGIYYNSSYLPKHKDVYWAFDPLMELIKEAHKYGIQVHPWVHTMYDYYATVKNPSWRVVSSSGSPATGWLNPSIPQVRNYLVNITQELIRNYPLDGIKLDTLRYPGSAYSYDAYTLRKFQASGMTDFSAFRRLQITECVEVIYDSIMDLRPYMWVGADIWMDYNGWYTYVFQDSREWARMGKMDYVTTMSYTTSKYSFEYYNKDIIKNSQGIPVVCGPYVYVPGNTAHGSVPNETVGIDLLLNQTETARRIGALGTCMFSYKFFDQYHIYADALVRGPFSDKALCPLKEQRNPVKVNRWEFDHDHDREGWRVLEMGHQYPSGGVWSISNVKAPSLMSPLLNITAFGTNVLEISMRTEALSGTLNVYWSNSGTNFTEDKKWTVPLFSDKDWHLYSMHLDRSTVWSGRITYIRIVPLLGTVSNITIDLVHLAWMPDCIRSWTYLGPFLTGTGNDLLSRDFLNGEMKGMPRIGNEQAGRTWDLYSMERDKVDLRFVLGRLSFSVAYVHVFIISDRSGTFELRTGSSDGMRAYLNSIMVLESPQPRCSSPDQNVSIILLQKGLNSLRLKLAVYTNDFTFFARITEPGNITSTGLAFLPDLKEPEPPSILTNFQGWTYAENVLIQWSQPGAEVPLTGYEWSIDNGTIGFIEGTELLLSGLDNGIHTFSLKAVDQFGLKSANSTLQLMIDRDSPLLGQPRTKSRYVTEERILWDWDLLFTPVSGIAMYRITVNSHSRDGRIIGHPVEGYETTENVFVLDKGLQDGFGYTISVTAVSHNGRYDDSLSVEPVIVDLLPPTAPTDLELERKEDGPFTYVLSWQTSEDNIESNVKGYEVWWTIGQDEPTMLDWTEDDHMEVHRPLYNLPEFKVRAVDMAGSIGPFSKAVAMVNLPPTAKIGILENASSDRPIVFSSLDSSDADGSIVACEWSMDDHYISSDIEFPITLEPGDYRIGLKVQDDLGAISSTVLLVRVREGFEDSLNGSFIDWVHSSSVVTVILPVKENVHYSNRTVILPDNSTSNSTRMEKQYYEWFFVMVLCVSMLLLMIVFPMWVLSVDWKKMFLGEIKIKDTNIPSDYMGSFSDKKKKFESTMHQLRPIYPIRQSISPSPIKETLYPSRPIAKGQPRQVSRPLDSLYRSIYISPRDKVQRTLAVQRGAEELEEWEYSEEGDLQDIDELEVWEEGAG